MPLAIFDLDNTLIAGDSDHAWGEFLVERGLVDPVAYKATNDAFYEDYKAGALDIYAYQEFALQALARFPPAELAALHREFMASKILPMRLPAADQLVDRHRQLGHTLLIITATNRFITEPIARLLGIANLLATEGERDASGRYTGKVLGLPCYREGKVVRLQTWLDEHGLALDGSYFYSDSHNDLPLLQQVANPVAVDPDPQLAAEAKARHWPVISLRSTPPPERTGS